VWVGYGRRYYGIIRYRTGITIVVPCSTPNVVLVLLMTLSICTLDTCIRSDGAISSARGSVTMTMVHAPGINIHGRYCRIRSPMAMSGTFRSWQSNRSILLRR